MDDPTPLSEIRRLAAERDSAVDEIGRANADAQVQQAIRAAVGVGVDEAEARKAAGDNVDAEPQSLDSMTKAELREVADTLGVDVPKGATKAQMVDMLGVATHPGEIQAP